MNTSKVVAYTLDAAETVMHTADRLNKAGGAAIAPIAGEINSHTAIGSWVLAGLMVGAIVGEHHTRGIQDPNEQFAKNAAHVRALERTAFEPRPDEPVLDIDFRTGAVVVLVHA